MTTLAPLTTTPNPNLPSAENYDASALGQDDFLTLMTAQLQNQDPFEPMENGDFLAQMAQFSTVSGIETLNETATDISTQIGGNHLSDAASMLGREVLVPGTVAVPGPEGDIRGMASLGGAAAAVTIRYTDAETYETLHVQELGAQPAGDIDFAWTDPPANVVADRRSVRITVEADGVETVTPHVYARVDGVTLPASDTEDLLFNVEGYGLYSSLEINTFR